MRKQQWINKIEESNETLHPYSTHLLKHILLPELLGKEEEMILYWAGKAMFRKLSETEINDLSEFFFKAGWGQLTLIKEKRNERIYELTAPLMEKDRPFTLESGFLSESTEAETKCVTEATYEVIKKDPCTCRITVRWDPKDVFHV